MNFVTFVTNKHIDSILCLVIHVHMSRQTGYSRHVIILNIPSCLEIYFKFVYCDHSQYSILGDSLFDDIHGKYASKKQVNCNRG